MSTSYAEPVLAWYTRNARDLPWRAPGARQGRSRAFRAYQASTGSAKDVDMMLPIVTCPERPLQIAPENGGERLADVLHLLHLHQVGKAVGALQGRS